MDVETVGGSTAVRAPIYAAYEEEHGFPPYDPRLMVKLLIYGYANGVTSSRKLEGATYRDVAMRQLCADQHPDFRSIARFRERHLHALGELFVAALRLCKQARLVGLGVLAVDGTKLRANASRHKAMSYQRMAKKEAQLAVEIAALRAQVDAAGRRTGHRRRRGRGVRRRPARRRVAALGAARRVADPVDLGPDRVLDLVDLDLARLVVVGEVDRMEGAQPLLVLLGEGDDGEQGGGGDRLDHREAVVVPEAESQHQARDRRGAGGA